MPQNRKQDILKLAIKGGRDSELLLLDKIHALEDQLDSHIEGMKSAMIEMRTDMKEMMMEMKHEMPNLDKVLVSVKGKDAESPTDEYLLSLIRPLVPEVKDGHTPTDDELLAIIRPLIPKVKDGNTPTKEELLEIIIPLIPKVKDGEKGEPGLNGSPDTPEEIRDKLELLEGEERLDKKSIKGLDEELKRIDSKPLRIGGGVAPFAWKHEVFNVDSTTTTITLTSSVGGGGLAIFAAYNGQSISRGTHFTMSVGNPKLLTLTFKPDDNSTINVAYMTMKRIL